MATTISGRLAAATAACLLFACSSNQAVDASSNGAAPPGEASAAGLLRSSDPQNGATLAKSPNNLVLVFSQPMRLNEVTIEGGKGTTMPMMVTAAGASERFSLPLSGLEADTYIARWRASGTDGRSQEGTIRFTVR